VPGVNGDRHGEAEQPERAGAEPLHHLAGRTITERAAGLLHPAVHGERRFKRTLRFLSEGVKTCYVARAV